MGVGSPVADLEVAAGQFGLAGRPPPGAGLLAGQPALQAAQAALVAGQGFGVGDRFGGDGAGGADRRQLHLPDATP